ncbi:hypothetical protein TSACC_2782 [Terrimicrobium sacchariphilum]|uniref:Uncharacterized protein n=1 Tax=Terrimicrobium sacchariphilum TaxID=690879 RepID=A0A146G5Z5_TERSA|nr:hypothetical protein [Terrimicrobium sacchariphilum]GAT32384.1 hypothetical protein TSACC_2782 [Terrimicrobium sacchariphilum]
MKIFTCLAIAAAFTASAIAAPKTILVDAQLVELATNKDSLPKDLSKITERKGVDVLTFPRQKTPSGRVAKFSATREVTVPRKGAFEVGVVLTVRPALADDGRIRYSVDADATTFEGFFTPSSSQAPIFKTVRAVGIEGEAEIGKPVVLVLSKWQDEQTIVESGKPNRTALIHRRVIAILTFSQAGISAKHP